METIETIVGPEEKGQRLDKYLVSVCEGISRSQIQTWIRKGEVTVNGKAVKPNYICGAGDEIVLHIPDPEPAEIRPEPMDLDIYYEDEDVIVINKPRGMVVHPSYGHFSGTLVNGLLYHCKDLSGINGVLRPGIVHRIDKDTSGLIMAAKNDFAHENLARQLKEKKVIRLYEAIVHGAIAAQEGTIEGPIGRDPADRKKMAITERGKPAVTHFRVVERFPGYTHIECRLETGRTHQIRVHMKSIGHPVAGDPKYGPKRTLPISGQALHAKVLGFYHPRTGEFLQFEAPPPADFMYLLQKLREGKPVQDK
jgi:ribosomal large subunit pseudouridine synthase D (EC 5.4.99.-)